MVYGLENGPVALEGPAGLKVTLLVDFACKALLDLRMETGVLVDVLDSDESDDPAAVMVCDRGFGDFSLNLGLEACSFSAFG